jgi:hypothetical protein
MGHADERENRFARRIGHAVEIRFVQSGTRLVIDGGQIQFAVFATGLVDMGLHATISVHMTSHRWRGLTQGLSAG